MGLSDKLKQLGDKAKGATSDHRDKISQAVETAGVVADRRTRGRYTDKIAKATAKTEGMVDRLAGDPEPLVGDPEPQTPSSQPPPGDAGTGSA
jgi:MT0933-like antitoxin protein